MARTKPRTQQEIAKLDLFEGNRFNAGYVELDSFATEATTIWIVCDEFIGRNSFKGMNRTGRQKHFRHVGGGLYVEDKSKERTEYFPHYKEPVYPW